MVTQISFQELYEAYTIYRSIMRLPRNKNSRRLFFQFLGFADDEKFFQTHEWMAEEPMRKVRWLTGPHAVAMYRVWEVQHGRDQG